MKKNFSFAAAMFLLLTFSFATKAQSWRAFNIIAGNPNATANELRYITASTGAVGSSIATTNGIPAANNNLPYGVAFDPSEGKLYYSKAAAAGSSVFNVYNNAIAVPTNTNITTVAGGEFFRMGVGQDGNVYGTVVALVSAVRASAPRIDIQTVKLTRYNPTTNVFTVLGNIQCPAVYASTMPVGFTDGNYWSSSNATAAEAVTYGAYTFALGHSGFGDLVVAPDNTMYVTIGKKLMRIPNYSTLTGTTLIPSVEVGNCMPAGVGFGFGGATSQGPGTYGISWDYNSNNLFLISSRSTDGRDGSYLLNPSTLALVGTFNIGPAAGSNYADLTEVLSSVGAAKSLTNVQWLGYNNRYRLTYRIRVENIGGSVLKSVQTIENIQTAFPALTISNVSAAFIAGGNPAALVLNASYNGTTNTNLFDGTKALYGALYNGANLNGGAGTVTAGSNFATVDITFDVAGVATNGTTTYNNTAVASANGFDGTSITDNSDNGTAVETGTANFKADDAGEGDATPIRFGSTINGTVWNDINNSANNTLTNIFTAGESGTNASGLNAILVDPITGFVIASVPVAANGTYSFTNVPSFANLRVQLSTTAGTPGAVPPATGLPVGWASTSPLTTNATGDINTGTYNSTDAVRFGAIDDPNNDFGIQRLPESAFNLQPQSGNPGGFNSATVPAGAFQTNNVGATPNTQDYDGGTVANMRITAFPSNANSITINGTIYTNGGTCPPAATCTPWPVGGVTVPYTNGTGPSQAISVDPVEGNVDVVIPFVAIDNAGREDATPGSVTMPFRTISLSGTVWNDANGNLVQNGAETVINGTNAGGGVTTGAVLYANLVDAGGNIIATVPVAADGTYNFPFVPQNSTGLAVQLSQNQGTVGLAKPATALPTGWVTTGENKNGQGGAADGTPNGEIPVTTLAANITQQNFGIERTPTSPNQNYTILTPLTNTYRTLNGSGAPGNPGPLTGTDPEDGALGTNNIFNIVVGAGMNGNKLFYNGVEITGAISIPNYDPALLQVQFTNPGTTSLAFTYQSFDAAGKGSNFATYTINWATPLPLQKLEATVVLNGTAVTINWVTESEVNVNNFIAERSTDNRTFTAVATVSAAGNSNGIKKYSTMDDVSSVTDAVIYYRIKAVDTDGKIIYSNTVAVRLSGVDGVKAWPNPFTSGVSVSVFSKINTKINLRITDASGKLIINAQYNLGNGNSQLSISNLQHLAKGVYIIEVKGDNGSINYVQKIIKE